MAGSFRSEIARLKRNIEIRRKTHFVNVASHAKMSVTDGSPLTGAPGQPVDLGNLKGSWQLTFTAEKALISTNVEYAQANEDGVNNGRPYTQRSPVGGRHSVKLTAAGLGNIMDFEARKLG